MDREKAIWMEGHFAGLAAAAIMQMAESGIIGADNDSFIEAFKLTLSKSGMEARKLADMPAEAMYDIWRGARYERLVEEYCDEQG